MNMMLRRLVSVVSLVSIITSGAVFADTEGDSTNTVKKAAIFIANHSGADMNDKMIVFEDMVTAEVTDLGFEVISREVAISAVGDLLKRSKKNELDTLLDDQTSALNLCRNLGADYLFFVSYIGLDTEVRHVKAYDVEYDNEKYTMRASYRIIDGNTGGALTAGQVEPHRLIQLTEHSQTRTDGLVNELMALASKDIASNLETKLAQGRVKEVKAEEGMVDFMLVVSLNDINFPQAVIDKDGTVNITANQATVQPLAVPVELDGFMIGTTGSGDLITTLQARPGIHRIKLVRDDLESFERQINIYDGQTLNIAMQLNAEGRKRWHENTKIFNDLLLKAKLTEAEIDLVRKYADTLDNYGYKIDIKVDTDEAISIENNKSLIGVH